MHWFGPASLWSGFTWSVLAASLLAAAIVAVVAYSRERRTLVWVASGLLAVALGAAATLPPTDQLASHPAAPLLTVLGLATAVFGGGPAAVTALDLAMGRSAVPGEHGGIVVERERRAADGPAPGRRAEVLRGGATIGVLERLATAGTIVAGFPEGLAIVVAIKGVGRFTELDAPEARERFIIGSFASLIWSAAAGLVIRLALS